MVDRASLTAEEMPCAEERRASLKCSEHLKQGDKAKECQDVFDRYMECKQKWVDGRNFRNRQRVDGGRSSRSENKKPEEVKYPWSQ